MIIIFWPIFLASHTLLWRILSREKLLTEKIEKLPYLIQKPLTCGVCFTFWLTFFYQLILIHSPHIFYHIDWKSHILIDLFYFVFYWWVTAFIAVFIYYLFLTWYEGSHYLAHLAEKIHDK